MSAWRRWLRNAAGSTAWVVLEGVLASHDAHGKPFAIVDKRSARLYVFSADGRLAGSTPALLGSALGDRSMPGVGERTQSGRLRPEDKTTPAGRFEAAPGENAKGEHVVWVDYDAAFAIHRLRPGFAYRARSARLASAQ